jgi:glucosamine 6-phosphate synthetase-like amidotransferase/phosphosugar isomerase protein
VELAEPAEHTIEVALPSDALCAPLVFVPVLQLLSYLWTVHNGVDPDSPPKAETIMEAMLPAGRLEAEARA